MRSEQEIRNMMLSCSKMGDANSAQGNQEEAYKYYRMGLEKAQELCGQSEDFGDRVESLPLMYEKLGITCYCLDRLAEAAAYFQNALKLRQNVPDTLWQNEDWAKGVKRRIAENCKILAAIYEAMGDENSLIECCLEGYPVSAELYNTYGTEADARAFLTFAQRLGVSAYLSDKLEAAFGYLQNAVKVRSYLNDEAGDRQVREEFAANYQFLGHIYYKINDFKNAAECYMKRLEIHLRIAQEYPEAESYGNCAWGYYHLSTAMDDAGEYDCLQRAAGMIQGIADRYPEDAPKYKDLYLQCLMKLKRFQQ